MKYIFTITMIFFLLTHSTIWGKEVHLNTKATKITIDEKGYYSSIQVEGKEILSSGKYPLLTVCKTDQIMQPTEMNASGNKIALTMPDKKHVTLKYHESDVCVTLEITEIPDEYKAVLFGPLKISIHDVVGDVIGVVQGNGIAFGMQALNIKTNAGIPIEYVDSVKSLYRYEGSQTELSVGTIPSYRLAATKTDNGTFFQFSARKRNETEYRTVNQIKKSLTLPVKGTDGLITGAKIALFGDNTQNVLSRIGKIELEQGLPHPLFDNEWGKTSQAAMQSYLISDFSEDDLDFVLDKAETAGFNYIYHSGPFRDWGHFNWDSTFVKDGDKGVRRMVKKAEQRGISIGIHTLSNFITTNDAYVTPKPSEHLLKQGILFLTSDIDAQQKEITIKKSELFSIPMALNAMLIENELITYGTCEEQDETILLRNCTRGAFGTTPSVHPQEAPLYKLWDYPYKTFFPDIELQDKMADRLAEIFNTTGLRQISFDGLEGCMYTGQDDYATARFVTRLFDQLNHNVLNDASNLNHFTWHIHTRMNWGEPWGADMRTGQVTNRIKNQEFFKRNLFPRMLGWFLIRLADRNFECTTMEDLEWALSESAGFDAGYAMTINMNTLRRHGQIDKQLAAIRNWDKLRTANAFTEEQKKRLRNPQTEWHLEKISEQEYHLYPLHISNFYRCNMEEMQPGQPGGADWTLNSLYGGMYAFRLKVAWEGSVRNPSFRTPESVIQFPCEIKAGQYLLYEFDGTAVITDKNYNVLQQVKPIGKALLPTGASSIVFSCEPYGESLPEVEVRFITKDTPEIIRLSENSPKQAGKTLEGYQE